MQTLDRSINTSLTVVLVLLAVLLFGGISIRWFTVALLIGVISGTYSSIFNASPLLVLWQEWSDRRQKKA
jgi:preprotein translocase subunit SecF